MRYVGLAGIAFSRGGGRSGQRRDDRKVMDRGGGEAVGDRPRTLRGEAAPLD
jgi:hypothetical protein